MDDLIQEFIAETSESLNELDVELVRLEKNPEDEGLISSIFRLVHTVKGTCGFLGLSRLEALAHSGENVLGKLRDKEMVAAPAVVSLILLAFDRIKEQVAYLAEHGKEPAGDDRPLIDELDAVAEGRAPAASPAAQTEKTPARKKAVAKKFKPTAEPEPLPELPPEEGIMDADLRSAAEKILEDAWNSTPWPDDMAPAPLPGNDAEPSPSLTAMQQAVEEGLKIPLPENPARPAAAEDAKSGQQSIRVNLDVLEQLMQSVSELVLVRNQLLQLSRSQSETIFTGPLQQLSHITTDLQESVMKTRIQPIGNGWSKFPRIIRDLAHDLGKQIELVMEGEETELDRQLLEVIKDPLTHMVRNSCDHGIEPPEDRLAAGKTAHGTVHLRAYHEGGHIIIEIADDGRGVNIARVRRKAEDNGIATPEQLAAMSDQEVMQFLFHPGFSTAEKVTNVSGRGVGMDVVKSNITRIGGTVELHSTPGQGSRFRIKIPLTLAIVSVLLVEAADQRFAIPQINVMEMVYVTSTSDYRIEMIHDTPVMRLRQKLLPLMSLSAVLDSAPPLTAEAASRGCFIVVCSVGAHEFGIVVDRIFDTEEIVVKPVAPILQAIDLYAGTTILGDGSVIMILDANGLAARAGGGEHLQQQQAEAANRAQLYHEHTIRFLLFGIEGDAAPKAVPLDLVARLEEIAPDRVEVSSGAAVVQYRDALMPLIAWDDRRINAEREDPYPVIVFDYESHSIGLVVDHIHDIAEARLQVQLQAQDPRLIGSMVLNGQTTDIIDVGYLAGRVLGNRRIAAETSNGQSDRRTVLLVDDSPFFRNLTAPFLSARGFDIVTAASPLEAFKLLSNGLKADAIVSDIEMPEMDGVTFARKCRAESRYQHIPMVALTSKMTPEAIREGLDAGFKAYISKTDREGLAREVEELFAA